MAKEVAKFISRSLGLLISKCKANGGFQYSTFTKLFDSLVWSVIEYGAGAFLCVSGKSHQICNYMVVWAGCLVVFSKCLVYSKNWSRLTKMSSETLNKRAFNGVIPIEIVE